MVPARHVGGSASQDERQERLYVLDKIVTCLESKKPSWQKVRILHLSTQLEDSMFNAKESMANYKDEATLPARITQHCRLLAASKTASQPPAAATEGGGGVGQRVRSFVATPESRGIIITDGHDYARAPGPGGLSSFGRRTSSNFVVGPPLEPADRSSQAAEAGVRGEGPGEGRDSAGSGRLPSIAASESTGPGRGISVVRVPLSALATAAAAGQAGVFAGAGYQGLNDSLGTSPIGKPAIGNDQHQRKQQHQRLEGSGGMEKVSENGVVLEHRGALLVSNDSSRGLGINNATLGAAAGLTSVPLLSASSPSPSMVAPSIPLVTPQQLPTPPASSEKSMHGSNGPHGSHSSPGETTEDGMNDDDDDDDDTDGDKAGEASPSAAAFGSDMVTGIQNCPPAAAAAAAAAAVEGALTEEEREDEEHASLNAVIAAASRGGWNRGEGGGVHHGSESEGQYVSLQQQQQQQQQPKATEAEVKQHALRLLQSRLLLLTHAATCDEEEEGSCPLAPLCGSVRQLLSHMQSCGHKKSCEFPHCASSKAVLQHKRMCKDTACGLCGSVRDLSQKCFWANARHLHKRRLEESHEQRRMKRQREGKPVAPPRKPQAEKAKGGRETCFGLDEQGNHLGDISLGFFLRQDKAVKARKALRSQSQGQAADADNVDIDHTIADIMLSPTLQQRLQPREASASTSGNPRTCADIHHEFIDTASVGEKLAHDNLGAALLEGSTPSEPSVSPPDQFERPPTMQPSVAWSSLLASPSPAADGAAALAWPSSSPEARQSPPGRGGYPLALATAKHNRGGGMAAANGQGAKGTAEAGGTGEGLEELDAEGMSGGGPEARGLRASSSDGDYACDEFGGGDGRAQDGGMKAVAGAGHYAGAGGMTVSVPSLGPRVVAGHLRSPSEIMLDEIAESLADTSRKPSFARMQSVQAFLDDHVELRQNASFGDVSAMVEQWMSLEDSACSSSNHSHHHHSSNTGGSNVGEEEGAFSF